MATENLIPTGAGTATNLSADPPPNWEAMAATDAKYVYVINGTLADSYQMANTAIPDAAIISKVVVTVSGLYTSGGGEVGFGLFMSGNLYGSVGVAITGPTQTHEFMTNPVTGGAWTKTAINGAELAIILYAGSGKTSSANYIYATVHYTLPIGGGAQIIGLEML